MLKQRGMVYERNCKNLYVYGNDSDFFASFLDTDARRPMCTGLLNPQEENSQHMIQRIIQLMVPRAKKGEVLCFSVPGKGDGVNGNLVYHEAVLKSFLQSLGYNVKAHQRGSGRRLLRVAGRELHRHRHLFRRRDVQRLGLVHVDADDHLQRARRAATTSTATWPK